MTEHREGFEITAALRVPIAKPALGSEEADLVRESIESGWVVQGPRVDEFERAFADYTGSQYAAATTSCSSTGPTRGLTTTATREMPPSCCSTSW